jgi:hypothetical protein
MTCPYCKKSVNPKIPRCLNCNAEINKETFTLKSQEILNLKIGKSRIFENKADEGNEKNTEKNSGILIKF